MPENLPYVTSPGTLKNMLVKIQEASLPERFTGDFVETKLNMKGGSARSVIPFIKKMGLVSTDGAPTEMYREFRNKTRARYVIARSMRKLYSDIFDVNEYANELSEDKLCGIIVQITGGDEKSTVTRLTLATFKMLSDMANFETAPEPEKTPEIVDDKIGIIPQEQFMQLFQMQQRNNDGINLSYTINLNLPATTNIEVFNAIFKSLKEHLINQ